MIHLRAQLIVRNEMGRYLDPCLAALLGYCQDAAVVDDGSDDGTAEWLLLHEAPLHLQMREEPGWEQHEGAARQQLLDFALGCPPAPTHLLAIDADEFLDDGQRLLEFVAATPWAAAYRLRMVEVWEATLEALQIRCDGLWAPRPAPLLFRVPEALRAGEWRMRDRELASGREPVQIRHLQYGVVDCPHDVFHFGWANPDTREERYRRYVRLDGGRYHNRRHLDSIVWPRHRIALEEHPWPVGIDREAVLARAVGAAV